MRPLVLLLSVFIGTKTQDCPGGFEKGPNEENCYTGFDWSPMARNDVYSWYSTVYYEPNSYLPYISNAFQNTRYMNNAGSVEFVWIGLTCLNGSVTSCQWDNGIPMSSTSYNNFDSGQPVAEVGPCVLLSVSNGKWYSADCSDRFAYFVLEYTPNVTVPYCDFDEILFRGQCYRTITANTSADAASQCASYSFQQDSIHSDGENAFVKSLASRVAYLQYEDPKKYQLFLGIQQNGTWTDGTVVDYTNYAYNNIQVGSCISMALHSDEVPAGKWISSSCSVNNGLTMCKQAPPIAPPPKCNGTYYSGSGTLDFNGFPLGNRPNHCEFVIIEDEGARAEIAFYYLWLDSNSTIQLFSGLHDETPFKNLTNIAYNGGAFFWSPTNILKVVYDTPESENDYNSWKATYF